MIKSFEFYNKKLNYYQTWYKDMSEDDRNSIIGQWIKNNCLMYNNILNEIISHVTSSKPSSLKGNYPS